MKRKIISGIICLAMLLSLLPYSMTASAENSNFTGSGTTESPYLIGSASDLTKLATLTNDKATAGDYANKVYQLTADIDMAGISYIPVSFANNGAVGESFTGTLDGNGHIIKNVTFDMTKVNAFNTASGIIGMLKGSGVVKNLGVENMSVDGADQKYFNLGGIVGYLVGDGPSVENCYVKGMTVSATSAPAIIGGIVGRAESENGKITNCYTTAISYTLTNSNNAAGIVGGSDKASNSVSNCYTTFSKIQGHATSTGGTMSTSNCYTSAAIADATVSNLGSAFKDDSVGTNGGHPILAWEKTVEKVFEGDGTEDSPYLIQNASDLTTLAELTNNKEVAADYAEKVYQLTSDIDMSGIAYIPISFASNGAVGSAFKGTLDGNGHIIKNVTFDMTKVNAFNTASGIIGMLSTNGVVKNLGVETMNAVGANKTYMSLGGIVGYLAGTGTKVENCYVKGMTATGTQHPTFVGGIVGRAGGENGTITNCYTKDLSYTLTNANYSAGIVAGSDKASNSVSNCYTTHSKVQGYEATTGGTASTSNCYTSATLTNATASNLGSAFKADSKYNNDGYPLLSWEIEKEAFEGEGTIEKPYLITSASDLTKLATLTNDKATAGNYTDKVYKLTKDIDMSGIAYTPISFASNGAVGAAFAGTLDGNGHIIKNIAFDMTKVNAFNTASGIIGMLKGPGVVKNLGVENMSLEGANKTYLNLGGIVGYTIDDGAKVENCYVKGMTVTATSAPAIIGGIVGRAGGENGKITNCYTRDLSYTLTNSNNAAGIVGGSDKASNSVSNCYTTHSRVQGNATSSGGAMSASNYYVSATLANATVSNLGSAFKLDSNHNNDGYPLLVWETEKPAFSGEGTIEKPYLITSANDLTKLAALTNNKATAGNYADKAYKLTQDIDMSGISYTPISFASNGAIGAAFAGTLDGNGHIIKNVTFDMTKVNAFNTASGIIGMLKGPGVVKNLGVENMSLEGANKTYLNLGGIVGYTIDDGAKVENCYVKGMTVTATATPAMVGGIIGRAGGENGKVVNCYTTNVSFTLTNLNNASGIIGGSDKASNSVSNCYTTYQKVQGHESATGGTALTSNCYTSATLANATVTNLGLAFMPDVDSINNGNLILTWEFEKNNPDVQKKTVTINKIGNGEIEIVNSDDKSATSIEAYSQQDVAFTLTQAEGSILTNVLYNGAILKEIDGKYTFTVGDGGELKVIFSEIVEADAEFYVSASGSDANDGASLENAIKSLEVAVNAAKAYKGTKVINIEEGVYNVKDTILLNSDNSGIIFRAYEGGEVVLNGGENIQKDWFTASDNANILVADLKANGITEYGNIKSLGYGGYTGNSDKGASPVLTIDGAYQVPARYPNSGYINVSEVVTGAENKENLSFKTSDSRVLNWVSEKDAWVFGYFKEEWADASLSVTVGADGLISADGKSAYGATANSRFYVFNALSELDTEGEYYIDREEGKMYIYKPSNWDSVENIVFSAGDNNIIEINGAENVSLEGLTITNTNASGIYAENADMLTVKNSEIKNIGKIATYITESNNVIIEGNDVKNIGYAGIIYNNAGDRQTLTSCNTEIKNNVITKAGIQRQAGAYAIDITNTVGVKVSGNDISDLPHGGILYMTCNDAVIEYNKIYNVIKDTSDAGAIYSGRNWTTRGNVIRYNYIHDIVDLKNVNNASAVYLDDMHSSTEVYNNVIYNVPQAVLLGGGRDNTFKNNLIIDCNNWIEADRRGMETDLSYMTYMLGQVPYTSEAWSKYDNLANILEDDPAEAKYNVIKDNVIYNSTSANFRDNYNFYHTVGIPEKVTDTGFFYSYVDKEFGLSANAKTINSTAYALVKDIPFAKMGFAVDGILEVENVELTEGEANLTANVKMTDNTSTLSKVKLIIAQYSAEGGQLEACSVKDIDIGNKAGEINESLSVSKDTEATVFKVFLWDADMKPLWSNMMI